MKAVAVSPAAHEIGIVDVSEPTLPSATSVKLQMLEVGVCGTDKEICRFEYGTPPSGSEHLILGHESLGRVVDVGDGVDTVKPGDLVVPMVRRPCSHADCQPCRSHRQDFCFTGDFTERGIKQAHGFMTEFVVDDQRYMNPVPETLRDVAVLVEPLTIAEKGLSQVWHVQKRLPWGDPTNIAHPGAGLRAVVLGAGPVGLLGAMLLCVNGFETFVYSRSPKPNPRADLVESFGANYVSSETHTPEQLAEIVGNIDLVYEAVGASSVSFEVMRVLGTNGVFVFTGVPGRKAPIEVDTDLIMRNLVLKNQVVLGTVNADRSMFQAAIEDLAAFAERWPEALGSLISQRYPMTEYRDLLLGKADGIKNVIMLS